MPNRMGRKSAAQTPAPKSDRIKGSKTNKAGSAASKKSAASIVVSEKVLKTLKDKADKYNENHTSKVSVNTLKAVFRRGSGAYSTSHRPTITGGAPNSRNAWSFARVNKFLLKKGGTKVKAAYVQDDDLMAKGGQIFNDKELLTKWKKGESIGFTGEAHLKAKGLIPRADGTKRKSEKYMEDGGQIGKEVICVNCSWYWNTNESQDSDKYVCHKCGFDNTFFYTDDFPNMQKFDEFADGRLKGAEKITNDSKEKGGLSMLTYYHYNAKLPTYEQASKGGFDLEKAKKEFEELQSQLSYNMKQIEFQEVMGKMEVLGELIIEEMSLVPENIENTTFEEEFKDGGVVVGKRHSEEDENGTGERFLVESTGQVVEVEGGEGVLSKESMSSDKKYDLDGEKLTGRQIASKLNHKYGGIEFAEGGEVGHVCGCRSKKYMHGGELPSATLQGLSGGEAVVTVKTMQSKDSYNFQGKKMNPRQILSKINADSGGKKFEEGGTIDLTKNIMEKELKLTKMVYFTENILYS